jgi:hypothetical protein
MRNFLPLVFLIVMAAPASAESEKINPGQYVSDGSYGSLVIQKDKEGKLTFDIESVGGNCHMCGVSGVIVDGVGRADDGTDEEDSKCLISFSAKNSEIAVEPITGEKCRYYCGARASFDGTYSIPPTACTRANRQAQRDRFLVLYQSRQYSQAADMLESLITQCQKFMGWIEIDKVRSDLALAQYHNHQPEQCLKTLNDTLVAEVEDEEELKSGEKDVYLPPCDFDNYIATAKTIWFNKALCTSAKQKLE